MKTYRSLLAALALVPLSAAAQGWPSAYEGVMLQGFSWDSYVDTQWPNLESQADDLAPWFSLVWVPQSGRCLETYNVMGYTPYYYFDQNSSFGTEAQLRSMIGTFKAKGIGTIADVVVNHHNTDGWFSMPAESYGGETYQLLPSDITADDDGGATAAEAARQGVALSANNDEGEDWSGMRDLDHKSANVQRVVKAYERFLTADLGYSGFRYDMVKGFAGSHVADYNRAAGVSYSVGEYWDGNAAAVKAWIDATRVDGVPQSAAFDFPFRYTVRDAINNGNWSALAGASLISDEAYRPYAVTFVENHDTQWRSASEQNDPIRRDTLAANAFLLAMPGTPCVFLPHWKAYRQEIKAMVDARKAAGVTNTSSYTQMRAATSYLANLVNGTRGGLIVLVGSNTGAYVPQASRYTEVLSGYHYKYFLSNSCEVPFVDKASGTYSEPFEATLTAVTAQQGAQLVYTLDGSTPTATNGTRAASGTKLRIDGGCTLTVGLLAGGSVTATTTRRYSVEAFEPHTATVYLKDPQWSTPVYFYSWANDGKSTQLLGGWPGTAITATTAIGGDTWYYHTFDVATAGYSFNVIFDQGSGLKQTVDIGPITTDKYYEIAGEAGGKLTVNDLTATLTGIGTPAATDRAAASADRAWFTVSGQRVAAPTQPGLYIHGGRKVVVGRAR